jgi:hypothetical protein
VAKRVRSRGGVPFAPSHGNVSGTDSLAHSALREDHPIYALVGRVAAEWANYESILDRIIWKLADLSGPRGACITAQLMGAGVRLVTITSLANHRGIMQKISDTIGELENRTYSLQENRNRADHDPWFLETPTNVVKQHRSQPKKQKVFGFVPIDSNSLDILIAGIVKLNKRAIDLHNEISLALSE